MHLIDININKIQFVEDSQCEVLINTKPIFEAQSIFNHNYITTKVVSIEKIIYIYAC